MSHYDPTEYGRVWASEYDQLFNERDDFKQLNQFIAVRAGSHSILEFGIGTGRVALGLAEEGFDVHGVDISQEMLDLLAAKPHGDKIHTILGDFTTVKVEGIFSLVIIAFSTLFLLESQEAQVACIANAARHLEPGGLLVVEAFVPDPSRWVRGQTTYVSSLSNDLVDLMIAVHDPVEQVIHNQHLLFSNEGIKLKPTRLRYAWPGEIDLMAQLADMSLIERYADYSKSPFTASSGSHVSVYQLPYSV